MRESSIGSSYWTAEGLAQAIIGIWFAASHQPWIVRTLEVSLGLQQALMVLHQNLHFIILELCQRPEYVSLIREELGKQESMEYSTLARLPILDSFIKESVRLNPLDKSESVIYSSVGLLRI